MTAVTAGPDRMPRPAASGLFSRAGERGIGASELVAALSTAFGVVLITATDYIAAILQADPYIGGSDTLAFVLWLLTWILVGVAVYVGAIVTANTFSTVVAGRTRDIALRRLIGASAQSERGAVSRQGLVVGVVGASLGLLGGTLVAASGVALAGAALHLQDVPFRVMQPVLLAPAAVVVLTTWAAARAGSRAVLAVTPLQAIGGSTPATHAALARRTPRNVVAIVLGASGASLLALGVLVGLVLPLGVLIAFVGGVLSFTGLAIGSALVMPPVLRGIGRLFGRSATARLAAENALRNPERSSRMAIGVVMGVTLVTMFAVAIESVKALMTAAAGGALPPELGTVLDTFSAIMMGVVGFCAVTAAVGLVNLLTIGVVQRRRELGLLRALGVSSTQVRRMVLLEATHITVAAVVTGLALGILYGWVAAQSLLGSISASPGEHASAGLVPPAVPWGPVLVIVIATAALTLVAAVVPTRLATRVAPVEALAE